MGVIEFTYFIAKVYTPKRIPSPKVYVIDLPPYLSREVKASTISTGA